MPKPELTVNFQDSEVLTDLAGLAPESTPAPIAAQPVDFEVRDHAGWRYLNQISAPREVRMSFEERDMLTSLIAEANQAGYGGKTIVLFDSDTRDVDKTFVVGEGAMGGTKPARWAGQLDKAKLVACIKDMFDGERQMNVDGLRRLEASEEGISGDIPPAGPHADVYFQSNMSAGDLEDALNRIASPNGI